MRGAFAKCRVANLNEDKKDYPLRAFRQSINEALLNARAQLNVDEYAEYLNWFNIQNKSYILKQKNFPVEYDYIVNFREASRIPLEHELLWIKERILHESDVINKFLDDKQNIEKHVLTNKPLEALDLLEDIISQQGYSLWAVQAKLGLKQYFYGLEDQKLYADELRRVNRKTFLAYIAYYTSIRNEDRTQIVRFSEQIVERIRNKFPEDTQNYLIYRLLNKWPLEEKEICDVFRIEQSFSIFDIYETFISFCQHVLRDTQLNYLKKIIAPILENFVGINDFRLKKIKGILGDINSYNELPQRDCSVTEELFTQGITPQLLKLCSKHNRSYPDVWSLIYSGVISSHRKGSIQSVKKSTFKYLLARFLYRTKESDKDLGDLNKLTLNLSGFSFAKGVNDFLGEHTPVKTSDMFRLYIVGMNSPYQGFEDIGVNQALDDYLINKNVEYSRTKEFWLSQTKTFTGEHTIQFGLAGYSKAIKYFRDEKFDLAITALEESLHINSGCARNAIHLLLVHAYWMAGRREKLVDFLATLLAANFSTSHLLPVVESVGNLKYSEYQIAEASLDPIIVIYSLWRRTEKDSHAADLRFFIKQLLKKLGGVRPSTMFSQGLKFPHIKVVFFLRYICIPTMLELSLPSTEEILKERREICGILAAVDSKYRDQYEDEIFSITHTLKVTEGLRLLDKNRIHVDVEGLSRWAQRNILEEFSRYKDLLALSDSPGDLSSALEQIQNSYKSNKQLLFTPENEADYTLIELVAKIREEFLNNSAFGLDFYLSKRIRHQSFVGLIRGPFDFAKIITTKNSEFGEYRTNDIWLEKFTTLTDQEKAGIDSCFSVFAERFDGVLKEIKDNILQLRSTEKPDGIFDIPLSPMVLFLARSIAEPETSLDEFLKILSIIFWSVLSPSLDRARDILTDKVRDELDGEINKLKADIRNIGSRDPAFNELSIALAQASSQLHDVLSEASAWFQAPELKKAGHIFTLEQAINTAVESAVKQHRSLDADISVDATGDVEIHGTSVIFIADVVGIAFGNVKKYSGMSKNNINITIDASTDTQLLSIRVVNKCSQKYKGGEGDKRLQEIRTLIDEKKWGSRTKKEVNSGFLKIAAAVSQSPKGSLEFGYLDDNSFYLQVNYGLRLESYERDKAA